MAEIKIYGTIVNNTTDQKAALARQLYDETLQKFQNTINQDTKNQINEINSSITSISSNLESLIVDNLTSDSSDKALSAKQGKLLKSLIDAINSFSIIVLQTDEDLPDIGNINTLYLKKKEGSNNDIYNEYLYIESNWELIGNTEIDLSNYYTKEQVYSKSEVDGKIPNIDIASTGSGNVVTTIEVDTNNKHKLNISKGIDVYSKNEIDSKLSSAGLGDVVAESNFTTADRVIVSNGAGKVIKDSGILIDNLALKSYVDEKDITWSEITNKPTTYTPSAHFHIVSDITDFPEIPEPIQVDSQLSSTSENPVQNKVINSALNTKLNTSALDNYYNKEEVDSKLSDAGGGDVVASGNLAIDKIVVGAGTKSIKDSNVSINSLITSEDLSTPTTFSWTNGTTVGPTGSLSGNNMEPVSYPAIPSASSTQSGIITTEAQNIKGKKTFDDGIQIGTNGSFSSDGGEFLGTASVANKVNNKLTFSGGATGEYDGSSAVTINIPELDIPIALPNPYSLSLSAIAEIPEGNVVDSIVNYNGSSTVDSSIKVLGYDTGTYESGVPYLTRINGQSNTVLLGNGKWGYPYLKTTTTPGNYGICDKSSSTSSVLVSSTNLSETQQTALIITKGNVAVSFNNSIFKIGSSVSSVSGNSSQYKCYALQYINDSIILVNCELYG